MQECARAILLTPAGEILLMKIRGWQRELWILPGGRLHAGEEPVTALHRELQEETGREGFAIGDLVWERRGSFVTKDGRIDEHERFYLVPTDPFEPNIDGFEPQEVAIHLGYRWWTAKELDATPDFVVPARLATHLRELIRLGPPPSPVDVSE